MNEQIKNPEELKPGNVYTLADSLAAIASVIMGFFLVRSMTAMEFPLGRVICSIIIITLSVVYLKTQGVNPIGKPSSLVILICISLMSISRFFSSDVFLIFLSSFALFFAFPYYIFVACGNSNEKYPASLFFFEELKAILVLPLGSIPCFFEALTNTSRSRKISKKIALVFIGIALAAIPSYIVILILSYDSAFTSLIGKIFDFKNFDLIRLIGDLILTLPVAVFLFGILYGSKNKRFKEILNDKTSRALTEKIHFAPTLLVASALTPFIFIYAAFFISQFGYYISAFGGTLPEGLTYSEYARSGFFELCAVSQINLFLISACLLFCRRKDGKKSSTMSFFSIIFSLFTLILIATALSKMALYITAYGLTVKRVLSSMFMLLLSVIFIIILLKQFIKKLPVLAIIFAVAFVLLSSMCFFDIDTFIANYNVDMYLSGELPSLDLSEFERSSDAYIIAHDKLVKNTDDEFLRTEREKNLRLAAKERGKHSFFSYTLPKIRAEKIIEKYK